MPMKTHGNSTHMHADSRQHIIQSHSTAAHINILTYYGSMITHMTSASTEQIHAADNTRLVNIDA